MRVSHWLPIVTFCPVNGLPDVIYVYVYVEGFSELYALRKQIRKLCSLRKCFMEDLAVDVLTAIPEASRVDVQLLTGRHIATARRTI